MQERERKERERAVRAKVAACAFARGYLGGIVKNVFQQLQDTGYFYDPVEREVRDANIGLSLALSFPVCSLNMHGHPFAANAWGSSQTFPACGAVAPCVRMLNSGSVAEIIPMHINGWI